MQKFIQENEELKYRVKLTGKQSKQEIAVLMQQSSFFVSPSEHETFGLVIAEAMSSGLPVIVGNETAPKEFVDNSSGILIPPRDIDALVVAMVQLIEHLNDYDSAAIRQTILDRFSFEAFGERLDGIYRDLITNRCVV